VARYGNKLFRHLISEFVLIICFTKQNLTCTRNNNNNNNNKNNNIISSGEKYKQKRQGYFETLEQFPWRWNLVEH
jgi:hypothetical protein